MTLVLTSVLSAPGFGVRLDVGPELPVSQSSCSADTLTIDSNGTLEGRESNRRVELVLVPCAEVE